MIFLKNSHFYAIRVILRTFLELFERTLLLRFRSGLKELYCSALLAPLLYLLVKFKARLEACNHELNFLSDVAKRRKTEAPFALLFGSPVHLQNYFIHHE